MTNCAKSLISTAKCKRPTPAVYSRGLFILLQNSRDRFVFERSFRLKPLFTVPIWNSLLPPVTETLRIRSIGQVVSYERGELRRGCRGYG